MLQKPAPAARMREAHAGSRPASGAQQICQRHAKLASCVIKRRSWQHRQAGCCAPPTAQSAAAPGKQYDLLALSNLCVDVFVPVDELPSSPIERSMLDQLELSPQWSRAGSSEPSWELGGNFNTMIAAARLGMRVGAIGHIGRDDYGRFCARVLEVGAVPPHAARCARTLRQRRPTCPVAWTRHGTQQQSSP